MSKHRRRSNHSNRRLYLIIAGVAAVLLLVLVLLRVPTSAGTVQSISPSAYQEQFVSAAAPHSLIDVRTPEEFAEGHISGALNIPVEVLEARLSEVPRDKPVVVYCRSGNRSAEAAQILVNTGYTSIRDLGGLNSWTAQGLSVVQ